MIDDSGDLDWTGTAFGPARDDQAGVKERVVRTRHYCHECESELPIQWPDTLCFRCWEKRELAKALDLHYRIDWNGRIIWEDDDSDERLLRSFLKPKGDRE